MTTLNQNYYASATLLLRLSLGAVWISHAFLKWSVYTIPGFASWLETQGLPGFMAWPVFLLETIGGLMIIVGYYGRYVSIVLLPILLVAIWSHIPNGWLHTTDGGGWEYPLFLVFASIIHALLGDGRFSISEKNTLLQIKNVN